MKKSNLFGKRKVQPVQVGNLVTVKGYAAGDGVNMFVSLVPDLAPITIQNKKGNRAPINAMICTAVIPEGSPLSDKLLAECEKSTHYGDAEMLSRKIILVDSKFMALPNKQQLALLNIENEKALTLADGYASGVPAEYEKTSLEQQLGADVSTIEIYGAHTFKVATKKAARVIRKSELKACKGLHRAYVKSMKQHPAQQSVLETTAAAADGNDPKNTSPDGNKPSRFENVENLVT
jgi:hypothetical protein